MENEIMEKSQCVNGETYRESLEDIIGSHPNNSSSVQIHKLIDYIRNCDASAGWILAEAQREHQRWLNIQADAAAARGVLLDRFGITVENLFDDTNKS